MNRFANGTVIVVEKSYDLPRADSENFAQYSSEFAEIADIVQEMQYGSGPLHERRDTFKSFAESELHFWQSFVASTRPCYFAQP
jgi:hypothetical protein